MLIIAKMTGKLYIFCYMQFYIGQQSVLVSCLKMEVQKTGEEPPVS